MGNEIKIAKALAANHINYLCSMSGKIIKNADKHTESYLSRIDSIVECVKKLKTEDLWVAAGNHPMTVMPWDDFYRMCA